MSDTKTPKVPFDKQLDTLTAGKPLFEQLKALVETAETEYAKAQKLNKAAGVRARKVLQRVRNTAKELRKEVSTFAEKTSK